MYLILSIGLLLGIYFLSGKKKRADSLPGENYKMLLAEHVAYYKKLNNGDKGFLKN
ncbi:MAG: hypothetical protein JWP78_1935 [Mucilaginibacter sp.]|nr:hypothetical protein [Mucilaginibacter sp.]